MPKIPQLHVCAISVQPNKAPPSWSFTCCLRRQWPQRGRSICFLMGALLGLSGFPRLIFEAAIGQSAIALLENAGGGLRHCYRLLCTLKQQFLLCMSPAPVAFVASVLCALASTFAVFAIAVITIVFTMSRGLNNFVHAVTMGSTKLKTLHAFGAWKHSVKLIPIVKLNLAKRYFCYTVTKQ